jgi:hypothetical protein
VEQLRAVTSENDAAGQYSAIAGWPAFQRIAVVQKPQPGAPADTKEAWHGDEQITVITTAIAAGNLLVREEARMPPDVPEGTKNEVLSIENGLIFRNLGNAAATVAELNQLRSSPRLAPAPAPASRRLPPPRQPLKLSRSSVQPAAGAEQNVVSAASAGGPAAEPEIAVSADGKNVVIAQQFNFATSNDGGLTWPYSGSFFGCCSTGGDASLAYGKSGNFYEATIFNSSVGLNYSAAANKGQSFSLLPKAFTCPSSGANQCGFRTGGTSPIPFPDQEHIAADRVNASASSADQVYVVWRHGNGNYGIACSTNSGQTFGTAQFTAGDFPRISVGQDGSVYVVYVNGANIKVN